MCNRILLVAGIGALLTFQGKSYHKVSFDSRCTTSRDFSNELDADVLSFANSDKPGVLVINPGEKFKKGMTAEFTDVVPDDALIIEYVEPEQETADADQDNQPDADA